MGFWNPTTHNWGIIHLGIAEISVTAAKVVSRSWHVIADTGQLVVALLDVKPAATHQHHNCTGLVCPQCIAVPSLSFQRLAALFHRLVTCGRRAYAWIVVDALCGRDKLRRRWQHYANCKAEYIMCTSRNDVFFAIIYTNTVLLTSEYNKIDRHKYHIEPLLNYQKYHRLSSDLSSHSEQCTVCVTKFNH